MDTSTYDVIVIGTGTVAGVAATRFCKVGWSVAIIDHQPFSGTCALRGCNPTKMLIAATEVIDGFARMGAIGTVKGDISIDWAALQQHKRSVTDAVPGKLE